MKKAGKKNSKLNKLQFVIFIISIMIIFIIFILFFLAKKSNMSVMDILAGRILDKKVSLMEKEKEGDFELTGDFDKEKGQVHLNWNLENSEDYLFKCFKKTENQEEYQTFSSTTFKEGEYIKVLNIYPNAGNNLASWMQGYGMGIIKVDQVDISTFNANPSNYLKKVGDTWNYNVVVFGFYDANNGQDLVETSRDVVKNFIEDGNGCIFGHDTISLVGGYLYHPYFASLASYVKITNRGYYASNATTSIYLNKSGVFTLYPWYIGEVGTHLTIPVAHTLDQVAGGDIWIKFNNNANGAGNTNFYLTTWNNCAMIQTGHSSGAATVDEQKILANLIFYTNQLTSSTEIYDYSGIDVDGPKQITGLKQKLKDGEKLEISINEPEDNPTKYEYYVEGTPKLDNLTEIKSDTISIVAETGFKGYSYIIDNNEECTEIDNIVENTQSKIEINKTGYDLSKPLYIHIIAVDNAGNKSPISTYELQKEDPAIYYYKMDGHILIGAISSKNMEYIKFPKLNGTDIQTINCNSKRSIAIDYDVKQNTTINVELKLKNGKIYKKELSIEI